MRENFWLLAGIGPGATYGLRAGAEMGENFYGSASLVLDTNGNLFLPIGLGFGSEWLQASAGLNVLDPRSPISGMTFLPLGDDFGVRLGFSGGSFGLTGLRVGEQDLVYVPGEPITSAIASFGANLGSVFTAGRTVRNFRSQLYEGRLALATSLPGGEFFFTEGGQEVLRFSSAGEVRRERRINQILSAIPVLGLIDHKGAIAEGTFDHYYKDYVNNTLVPGVEGLTEQYAAGGIDLTDPGALRSLEEDYYSFLIAYSILKRVADREGRTGENAPPELLAAGDAIANFENAAAGGLNAMLKAKGMQFYEDEVERYGIGPNSPAPYLEVSLGRFSEDLAGMERWLANHEESIVLHGENFAPMMAVYTLWVQDDFDSLISAVNSGHIKFRTIDGRWVPTEVVVESLRQFSVTNPFGTNWSVLPDETTYSEYLQWVEENRTAQ